MPGKRTCGERLLVALVFVIGWLCPKLAAAETVEQLRAQIVTLIERPPSGTQEEVCARLDPPYWRLRELGEPTPEILRAPRDSLELLRNAKACGKCPNKPCTAPAAPTCASLSERFNSRVERWEACTNDCKDAEVFGQDVLLTFVDVVKECPRGDPRSSVAISKVSVVVAPKKLVERLLVLLRSGKLPPSETLSLLEQILGTTQPSAVSEALKLLAQWARQHSKQGAAATDGTILDLFTATNQLLSGKLSKGGLESVTKLLSGLASDEQAGATLELLKLARDLKDPSKAPAMQRAIQAILQKYSELNLKLPRGFKALSFEDRVAALLSILNNAQIVELNQNREKAEERATVSVALRRLRLKFASQLPMCVADGSSAACKAAQSLRDEFLKTLKGESPQSADDFEVTEPLGVVLGDAAQLLRSHGSCESIKQRNPSTYAALCSSPFAGFVGLEVNASKDASTLQSSVTWVVGGLNDAVEACSTNQGSCVGSSSPADVASATTEGADLARLTLRRSGVAKWFGHVRDDPASLPPVESGFAKRWRQIGRPAALIGALGLVTGGVYVSNTQPNKSTGDWLWRSGMLLLVVEIGAEGWLYFK